MSTSVHSIPSGLSLRANFSWTFVGNVVYAGCQWAMLVVLVKLGSPEMVGQFALGLAITVPVMMFANLELRVIQATDARHEYLFGNYFGLRLVSTVLALVVIVGIVLVADYRRETALIVLAVGVSKAFESISDVCYGLLQQHERMDCIAKSMIFKGILSLAALSVGVYLTSSVFWGVVGLVVARVLILISYDVRIVNWVLMRFLQSAGSTSTESNWETIRRPRWEPRTLARLVWLALPLGLAMMLKSFNLNIPTYFVEQYLGERELGIFAAIGYLRRVGATVANALMLSASPRLAKHYAAGNSPAFLKLLFKLVAIGAFLGGAGALVAMVAGRQLLLLLYAPEYAEYTRAFLWLMIAAGLRYVSSSLGVGMTAARYFKVQVPLSAICCLVITVASMFLIPSYGVLGAAWAVCLLLAFQLILRSLVIIHALRERARKDENKR